MPRYSTSCSSACVGPRRTWRRRAGAGTSTNVVRLMTPPSLATHWLMPRLPAFIEAHPGIDLRVFAVRTADGNADDFDITIRYGAATRWKGAARPLLEGGHPALLRAETAARQRCPQRRPAPVPAVDPEPGERRVMGDMVRPTGNPLRQVQGAAASARPVLCRHRGGGQEASASSSRAACSTEEHVRAGRLVAPLREARPPSTSYSAAASSQGCPIGDGQGAQMAPRAGHLQMQSARAAGEIGSAGMSSLQ